MVEEINRWLSGMLEENPIPFEINHLVFDIYFSTKYSYLTLSGYEGKIDKNAIIYFPLEAQFFTSLDMKSISKKVLLFRLREALYACFDDIFLKNEFKNKKIYLSCGGIIEYLFTV